MQNQEIESAIRNADLSAATSHLAVTDFPPDRQMWRVPTPCGELRIEEREGWLFDVFSLGGEMIETSRVAGSIADLFYDLHKQKIPTYLDLSREEGDRFVANGAS